MQAPYADGEVFAPMPWWVWVALGLLWVMSTVAVAAWLHRRSRRQRS